MLNQRTITLVSLSLKHVYEDQMRLQKKSDLKKESEKKKQMKIKKKKKRSRKMREKIRGQIQPLRKKQRGKKISMQKRVK